MASLPIRDPIGDHLLTPPNAVMVVIEAHRAGLERVVAEGVGDTVLNERLLST
jgi:hypothetical protein